MPRLIAFLRAINVGGRNVTMVELRRQFSALGLKNVETFIASGNVVFTAPSAGHDALVERIEARLQRSLGYEVGTFLRTDAEVAAIAQYLPFPPNQMRTARALNVGLLAEPLPSASRKALEALANDFDAFHVNGRELYWLCRGMQSESIISNRVLERALAVRSTFRSLRTVTRLAAKYPPAAELD